MTHGKRHGATLSINAKDWRIDPNNGSVEIDLVIKGTINDGDWTMTVDEDRTVTVGNQPPPKSGPHRSLFADPRQGRKI